MRLFQQIRPSDRAFRRSGRRGPPVRFRHAVSAFGQTPHRLPRRPATPSGQTTSPRCRPAPRSPSKKRCGWRSRTTSGSRREAESADPGPRRLAGQRDLGAVAGRGSRSASTAPPTDFNTSSASQLIPTNANVHGSGGLQQLTKWGGNYSAVFTGSRPRPTTSTTSTTPARIASERQHQPAAAAQLQDRREPSAAAAGQNQPQAADLQLQQRIDQTSRSVRAAYYNLVGAIAGLDVAQQSLDLARTRSRTTRPAWKSGTMAPIDIVRPKRKSRATKRT